MKVNTKVLLTKVIIHCVSLLLMLNTFLLAVNDDLGGDPVKALIHFTGMGALNLLLLSLLISPVAKRFKQAWLMQIRRLIGLYAFSYALLHILSFIAFDLLFDWSLFFNEIIDRPYILLGMTAFIILFLLALTSFHYLKKKLGKKWQTLHNFVYIAVMLAGIHFYWSVKSAVVEPIIYLVITLLLLSFRKAKFRRWLQRNPHN